MGYLTTNEVARHFRVQPSTIRSWIKQGRIAYENIGTELKPLYRFREDTLSSRVIHSSDVKPQEADDDFVEFIK